MPKLPIDASRSHAVAGNGIGWTDVIGSNRRAPSRRRLAAAPQGEAPSSGRGQVGSVNATGGDPAQNHVALTLAVAENTRSVWNWCGREESNFHGVSPTSTSS
jgi:hypothetical protein